jgi:hypothetical protein
MYVVCGLGLLSFALVREKLQEWLTSKVFSRRDPGGTLAAIRQSRGGETDIVEGSARRPA